MGYTVHVYKQMFVNMTQQQRWLDCLFQTSICFSIEKLIIVAEHQ